MILSIMLPCIVKSQKFSVFIIMLLLIIIPKCANKSKQYSHCWSPDGNITYCERFYEILGLVIMCYEITSSMCLLLFNKLPYRWLWNTNYTLLSLTNWDYISSRCNLCYWKQSLRDAFIQIVCLFCHVTSIINTEIWVKTTGVYSGALCLW